MFFCYYLKKFIIHGDVFHGALTTSFFMEREDETYVEHLKIWLSEEIGRREFLNFMAGSPKTFLLDFLLLSV